MSGQNKAYIVFYGTQWGTSSTDANGNLKFSNDPAGAAGAAQQMFKGIGTDGETWPADLTQWCDGAASRRRDLLPAPGATHPLPEAASWPACGTTTRRPRRPRDPRQLANEAIKAAAHFGNTTAASNR